MPKKKAAPKKKDTAMEPHCPPPKFVQIAALPHTLFALGEDGVVYELPYSLYGTNTLPIRWSPIRLQCSR